MSNVLSLDQVFAWCQFLSSLTLGQKPCFSTLSSNSFLSSLTRKYWYMEDRNVGLSYISVLIASMRKLLPSSAPQEFLSHLNMAISGCNTLALTYAFDPIVHQKYISYSCQLVSLVALVSSGKVENVEEPIELLPDERQAQLEKIGLLCQSYYGSLFEDLKPSESLRSKLIYPFFTQTNYYPN